jgi:hypothetical protein
MQPRIVDFVVEGIDDHGRPSGMFLQVAEVVVLDSEGRELGRFRDARSLKHALMVPSRRSKLVATQTVGLAESGLIGLFLCDEQAWPDVLTADGDNAESGFYHGGQGWGGTD